MQARPDPSPHALAAQPAAMPDAGQAFFAEAAALLAMLPDEACPQEAAGLLHQHYGIAATVTPLSSEVEQTFEARLHDGPRLILKTSARPQAIDSFRFQSAVLAGLADDAGIIVPRIIPTASGAPMFGNGSGGGYLQSCMDGPALHKLPPAPGLLRDIGAALALLNLAMKGLEPQSSRRPVLWNIACWPWLMELNRTLPEGPTATLVRRAMAEYAGHVAPQIRELDWQVTHNDPSPFNMIATPGGIGFIDFGDGGWNPRIQDLAIAAGHFVADPALPLGGAEHVIAGYAAVLPLSDMEIALLPGLMRARQSALVLINHWRAQLFPEAARYIMKNVHRAEQGLAVLAPLDASAGAQAVRAATTLTPPL
ncbi:MAG: phosphotransferase [Novosphingobium sp.]|nr:phosphotransferase [Novosphingobium sp.]